MTFWKKNESLDAKSIGNASVEPAILNGSSDGDSGSKKKDLAPQPAIDMNLPVEERLEQRYGKARSALGSGTVIQGKLSFDTPVRIDGKLGGEIFSSKALIVGPTGSVSAEVQVAALVVMGTVTGNIVAADRVEVLSGGKIEGNVTAPVIYVEEGAVLNGHCSMKAAAKNASTEASDQRTRTAKQSDQKTDRAAPQPTASGTVAGGTVASGTDGSKTAEAAAH